MKKYYTASEVAKQLKVSRTIVSRLISYGRLVPDAVSNSNYLFDAEKIEAFKIYWGASGTRKTGRPKKGLEKKKKPTK